MKNIIVLFLGLSMMSCSKDKPNGNVVMEVGVGFLYKNQNGNLFGPQDPTYSSKDVKIYYVTAGREVPFYQANLDHPGGFEVRTVDSLKANMLNVLVNHQLENGNSTATTLVKIGDGIVDTVTCEIAKPNSASSIVTKVWLNGELRWDVYNPKNPAFEYGNQRAITVNK